MSNPNRVCSICSAPSEVQEIVAHALANKVFMRTIAEQTGFSKSAVHRHSSKCLTRAVLNQYRDKRAHAMAHQRIVVAWPTGELTTASRDAESGHVTISKLEMRESDILFVVKYERRPNTLRTYTEAIAENLERSKIDTGISGAAS